MIHKYSAELLIHILCGDCVKWFTISELVVKADTEIYCSHCGVKGRLERK